MESVTSELTRGRVHPRSARRVEAYESEQDRPLARVTVLNRRLAQLSRLVKQNPQIIRDRLMQTGWNRLTKAPTFLITSY